MTSLYMLPLILCKSFSIFELRLRLSIPVQNFIVIRPLTTMKQGSGCHPPPTNPNYVKKPSPIMVNNSIYMNPIFRTFLFLFEIFLNCSTLMNSEKDQEFTGMLIVKG